MPIQKIDRLQKGMSILFKETAFCFSTEQQNISISQRSSSGKHEKMPQSARKKNPIKIERVVCLDISKAFDEVNCTALFKLHQLGATGSLLNLMRSYLSGRSQIVPLLGISF